MSMMQGWHAKKGQNAVFAIPETGRPFIPVRMCGGCGCSTFQMMVDSVSGDSRLYWKDRGRLRFGTMEDLYVSYVAFPIKPEFEVLSVRRNPKVASSPTGRRVLCANNAEVCFARIDDVSYHGIRPVWKVTLHNGKTVEITRDHSLFTGRGYGNEFNERTLLDIQVENEQVVSVDKYQISGQPRAPVDNTMLMFMGLWLADGSYKRLGKKRDNTLSGVFISTGRDQAVVTWLEDFAHLRGVGFNISDKGDLGMNSKALAVQIFSSFGEVDSYSKRVPEFLFTAADDQIAAFLKGYFSGDGSVHICNNNPKNTNYKYGAYYAVDCASASRDLLEDISVLLDRLGIKHNISTPHRGHGIYKSRLTYKLVIHASPSVEKFMDKVGFIKERPYSKREYYERDKKLRPVSMRTIRHVEFIGPKPVYDISVADTQAFVANGILCHNTGNDVSLLNRQDAQRICLRPDRADRMIRVAGISQSPMGFDLFGHVPIQIGNTDPVSIPVAVGDVRDNLLGREGVRHDFDIFVSRNQVSVRRYSDVPIANAHSYEDSSHSHGGYRGGYY